MLNTLLESKPKKERSLGGSIFSLVLHSVLIAGSVWVTAQALMALHRRPF